MNDPVGRRRLSRWHPATVGAGCWTVLSILIVRRALRRDGVTARVTPPSRLPAGSYRGVQAVLRRLSTTCLETALVQQGWLAGFGAAPDVVVGVDLRDAGLAAHAWLDCWPGDGAGYHELYRLRFRGSERISATLGGVRTSNTDDFGRRRGQD